MTQHPQFLLPNDPNKDIWIYKLLQINLAVFDDYLVNILQVPLVDKWLIMNAYIV